MSSVPGEKWSPRISLADALDVIFPKEKITPVMAVVRRLEPDEGGKLEEVFEVEDRYRRVMLWWD